MKNYSLIISSFPSYLGEKEKQHIFSLFFNRMVLCLITSYYILN
jgi:hypothetical protein